MLVFLAIAWAIACAGSGAQYDQKAIEKSQTRLDLAKDFLSKGQLEGAETEAHKALAFYPGNEEAHYLLGLVDFLRGLAAHNLLEVDECMTGVDAEVLRAEKDTHLSAAEAHFVRATEIDPEFGEPLASRGTIATLLGRYDEAVEYLTTALSLPARLQNIALVRANLGWAYFHKANLVSAAKELLQAAQFQPGMCVATYRLGRVYFARKEWEKALQKFRDVVGRDCPIQDAHLYLMRTYVAIGSTEEQTDPLPVAEKACVALAPRSCVAAQCRLVASEALRPGTP